MDRYFDALWAYIDGVSTEATTAGGLPLLAAAFARAMDGDPYAWLEFWGGLLMALVPQSETKRAVLEAWHGAG